MSWLSNVVGDFGRSLGIEQLDFNEEGLVSLKFEIFGDLYLEKLDTGVLVYLVRELSRGDRENYAEALELCHWKHQHPFLVSPALSGDRNLVFSVKVSETQFDVPTIEQLLQFLSRLHDQAQEGAAT